MHFEIEPSRKEKLLQGLDPVALTLKSEEKIKTLKTSTSRNFLGWPKGIDKKKKRPSVEESRDSRFSRDSEVRHQGFLRLLSILNFFGAVFDEFSPISTAIEPKRMWCGASGL